MGKLKKGKRNQKFRHNPLSKKNNGVSEQKQIAKDENVRKSKIVPLIEKLHASAPSDRAMALSAISILVEDDRMRILLLKERLVPVVMEQCLTDSNDEIMVEAFGLLRNIAIDEGYDIIMNYWRSNIWTNIESSLAKIQKSFKYLQENDGNLTQEPKKRDDEKSKQQLLYEFTDHIVSLIVVIANGSDDLFTNIFNKIEPLLEFVVDLIQFHLKTSKLTDRLFNSLLDFIYEFSCESDDFIRILNGSSKFSFESLYEFVNEPSRSDNKLAKVYMEGLKFHLNEVFHISNKDEISKNVLEKLFSTITTIDLENTKSNLLPRDNANEPITSDNSEGKPEDIDKPLSGASEAKQEALMQLQTIEIAVDLTTAMWEFLAINDQQDFGQPVALHEQLIDIIFTQALPSIIELIRFNHENNNILQIIDKLIICINNLSWLMLSLDNLPIQWYDYSFKLWDLTFTISETNDETTQKDCLSVLWALTQCLGPEITSKINGNMIDGLLEKTSGYANSVVEKTVTEDQLDFYISAVGFTGSVAPIINNIDITRKISEFLLLTIDQFTNVNIYQQNPKIIEITIESTNSLFRIFGDKEFDYDYEIFVKGDYVTKLLALEKKFKDMYKKIDKNKTSELKLRGEETWTNLGRFIQYKIGERS